MVRNIRNNFLTAQPDPFGQSTRRQWSEVRIQMTGSIFEHLLQQCINNLTYYIFYVFRVWLLSSSGPERDEMYPCSDTFSRTYTFATNFSRQASDVKHSRMSSLKFTRVSTLLSEYLKISKSDTRRDNKWKSYKRFHLLRERFIEGDFPVADSVIKLMSTFSRREISGRPLFLSSGFSLTSLETTYTLYTPARQIINSIWNAPAFSGHSPFTV